MESQQGHETRHGNALVLQSIHFIAVVRREVSKLLASVAARVVWMVVVLVVLVAVVAVVSLMQFLDSCSCHRFRSRISS